MTTYRFASQDGAWPLACEKATVIPGVKAKYGHLYVPHHALDVVKPLIHGVPYDVKLLTPYRTPEWRTKYLADLDEVRWNDPGLSINKNVGGFIEEIKLTEYQRKDPQAWREKNPLFHWAPGGGKTLGMLLWALFAEGPIVVVCPARVRLQWRDEIRAFTKIEPLLLLGETPGEIDFQIFQKDNVKHRVATPFPAELPRISIVAWEILPAHVTHLLRARPVTLVLDEPHRAKNKSRWIMVEIPENEVPAMQKEKDGPRPKRLEDGRWVKFLDKENIVSAAANLSRTVCRTCEGTATPVKHLLSDMWAQIDYLDPFSWGNYKEWTARYCNGGPYGYNKSWVAKGYSNVSELAQRLTRIRSRVPVTVSHANLPPMRRQCILIPREMQSKSVVKISEIRAAAARGNDSLIETKLMDAASRKRKVCVQEVTSRLSRGDKTKIVVFTGRKEDRRELTKAITNLNPDVTVIGGDGDDSDVVRHAMVTQYMTHPGPCVLVGTRDAFGESINLHDTDIAMMAMLPWTPGDLIQNEYRFRRLGMKRNILVLYMIAEGTFDEKVASIVIRKMPAAEVVGQEELVGMRSILRGTTPELAMQDLISAINSGGLTEAEAT